MKNLNGKTLLRGDAVIAVVGGTVQVGTVAAFYDRTGQIRITGYPINLTASETVLAQDVWNAFAQPLLDKKRADDAAALATKQTPPPPPQSTANAPTKPLEQSEPEKPVEVAPVTEPKPEEKPSDTHSP